MTEHIELLLAEFSQFLVSEISPFQAFEKLLQDVEGMLKECRERFPKRDDKVLFLHFYLPSIPF